MLTDNRAFTNLGEELIQELVPRLAVKLASACQLTELKKTRHKCYFELGQTKLNHQYTYMGSIKFNLSHPSTNDEKNEQSLQLVRGIKQSSQCHLFQPAGLQQINYRN